LEPNQGGTRQKVNDALNYDLDSETPFAAPVAVTSFEDGKTYGTPTWIWSVVVDEAFYVRAYNGRNSRWYQAAMLQTAGGILVAGMTKEVTFEDSGLATAVDSGSVKIRFELERNGR
jgi:hypothetical protein